MRDHLGAATGVVRLALLRPVGFRDHVRAVERIVETAPSGIGGVERVTRIVQGHDELGPRYFRDLIVDIGRAHLKWITFRKEIADLDQKGLVFVHVDRLPFPLQTPGIDLFLQRVSLIQKRAVLGPEIPHDLAQRVPKGPGFDAGAGRDFVLYQAIERLFHFEAADVNFLCHGSSPSIYENSSRIVGRQGSSDSRGSLTRLHESLPASPFRKPCVARMIRRGRN